MDNYIGNVMITTPNWAREVREIYPVAVKGYASGVSGGQGVGLQGLRGPTGSEGIKGWAYRVPESQGVGLQGPRGSRGRPKRSRGSRGRPIGSQGSRGRPTGS